MNRINKYIYKIDAWNYISNLNINRNILKIFTRLDVKNAEKILIAGLFMHNYKQTNNIYSYRNYILCLFTLLVPEYNIRAITDHFNDIILKDAFNIFIKLDYMKFIDYNVIEIFGCCCVMLIKLQNDCHKSIEEYALILNISSRMFYEIELKLVSEIFSDIIISD